MRRLLILIFLITFSQATHAAILSLGALSDASGTRGKISFYEDCGNDLQNIGLQFDYFSYSDTRAFSQIALRHINFENSSFFYRAATLEKLRMGLGLNMDNYYSQAKLFFDSTALAHSAGVGAENYSLYVFGQNQGLGGLDFQIGFESSDHFLKSTFVANAIQQDAYLNKTYFHSESVGLEFTFGEVFKVSYETGQQLANQQGNLLRLEVGKLDTASAYYETDQYQNGFIPKYVNRIYQNYYLSNQNLANRNLNGQISEYGLKLAWGSDNRVQLYQRSDQQNAAWGADVLWALGETVFFEYEYEKPLPLYNLAAFQKVEFQKFKSILTRQKDAQFVLQFQKMIDATGISSDDLALEYLLKL